MMHRFELHRDAEVSSGDRTGIVAEGVAFSNGLGDPGPVTVSYPCGPTIVFPEKGLDAVVNQHSGRAHLVWLDEPSYA